MAKAGAERSDPALAFERIARFTIERLVNIRLCRMFLIKARLPSLEQGVEQTDCTSRAAVWFSFFRLGALTSLR